jgi:predicted AAA+ superfamily ATPase
LQCGDDKFGKKVLSLSFKIFDVEALFRTHKYLVEHVESPVQRQLMDEIDWNHRLIGVKGSRGVGKTTFLLEYAKQRFGADDRSCLYINLNNFYFTTCSLYDFADEFCKVGGRTLLIDQVFKLPNWSEDLRECYDKIPDLNIVFSGSSVMRLKEENLLLRDCVKSYNLRGFSFREYLNLMADTHFKSYTLDEILKNHVEIASEIVAKVKPLAYFQNYLHHGFSPFFLEKRNFSENLLKTMNMMLEVDVLFIKQIELKYLPKIRKLLYLIASTAPSVPNVSQLSTEINISRATVMNYIKYLSEARLFNLLYAEGDEFPKKPAMVYMQNTNLMHAITPGNVDFQAQRETFFYNVLYKDHKLNKGNRDAQFLVDHTHQFVIADSDNKMKFKPDYYYAIDKIEVGSKKVIPLWLFGFLY